MEIKLYTTEDAETVINKELTLKYELEMQMKSKQNVTQPTIVLQEGDMDLQGVNYAYIPDFERYYFIRSFNVGPNQIYDLLLECDVLETFKDEILSSKAEITRNIQGGDYMEIPGSLEVRKEVDVYKSNRGFKNEESIIFSTIGQQLREE